MNLIQYLLICLAEECGEVDQRATKALRFGLDECQPGQNLTNRERLLDELDDLLLIREMLIEHQAFGISTNTMMYAPDTDRRAEKRRKIHKYMRLSYELGILDGGRET